MSTMIPVPLLSLMTAKNLEQYVCGMEEIDIMMLKKVVRYKIIILVMKFFHILFNTLYLIFGFLNYRFVSSFLLGLHLICCMYIQWRNLSNLDAIGTD